MQALAALAAALDGAKTLEEAMQLVADRAASILATERISVRLLDPSKTRLLATARAGEPMHSAPVDWHLGEGLLGWIAKHGRPILSGDAECDPRFIPKPGMKDRMGSFVGVPIIVGARTIGVISAASPDLDRFTHEDEDVLSVIASLCARHLEVARLQRLAEVDPATGALNKNGMESRFPDGLVSVALADIDDFASIVARHGRAGGDAVLAHIVKIVAGILRAGDAVVRHGDDELLLILPGVGLPPVERVAERARAAVEASVVSVEGAEVRCTISVGVAERGAGESRDALIARAERAMHAAQHAGRNAVRVD